MRGQKPRHSQSIPYPPPLAKRNLHKTGARPLYTNFTNTLPAFAVRAQGPALIIEIGIVPLQSGTGHGPGKTGERNRPSAPGGALGGRCAAALCRFSAKRMDVQPYERLQHLHAARRPCHVSCTAWTSWAKAGTDRGRQAAGHPQQNDRLAAARAAAGPGRHGGHPVQLGHNGHGRWALSTPT